MLTAFILIVIHYIADFMFQTEKMALGKSKSLTKLMVHCYVYTSIFFLAFVVMIYYNIYVDSFSFEVNDISFLFFPIIFFTHFIIDYVSSKITARKFEKKEYYTGLPNFGAFSIIGLDQVAHYGTLFLSYYILTK